MTIASAVTEKAFAARRRDEWEELDALTRKAQRNGITGLARAEVVRLSPVYRSVCADLAAAQAARYSAPLVEYLLGLTAGAHTVLYGPHARIGEDRLRGRLGHGWLVAFPRAVRRHRSAMLLAAALFFVPLAIGAGLTLRDPSFAFRVVPEAMLRPLTEAYAHGFAGGRDASEGTLMAGFYVYNNVGIALRCFALGIAGGLGSAFYLVQNGLSIGAILGYVASQGAGGNIVLFIVGHGSLELGAIVLAGGSGLSIGWALVSPGDLPRVVALQRRARDVLVIVAGASVMLALAAAVEAFWSASSAPPTVKLAVGGALFVLLLAYVLLGGRGADRGRG
jgi:uncharacterized membrane protein SpoIIM required for sporulation